MAKSTSKPAKASTEIKTEDINHEVIGTTLTELSTEERIKLDVAKFNLADARIAELKKAYGGLTIAKDGIEKVKEARTTTRNLRTGVERKRTELKEDILTRGRAIDGEAKRLTALLLEIETPLDSEIKAEEEAKAKAKREAEEAAQILLQGRVSQLLENGVQFNGSYYAIGETITIDVITLKNFTDEKFTALLDRVKQEHKIILDAQEAEKQRQEAERAEFERQKQEQAKTQLELTKQQEAQERDRQQLIKDRRELRAGQLDLLGFAYNYRQGHWELGVSKLLFGDLGAIDGEAWKEYYNQAATASAEEKKILAAIELKEQQRKNRIEEMNKLNYHFENGKFFIITETYGNSNFLGSEILDYSDSSWDELLKDAAFQATETCRQDVEQKEIRARKVKRERELEDLGFSFSFDNKGLWLLPGYKEGEVLEILLSEVESLPAEGWAGFLETAKGQIAKNNEGLKQKTEAERIARLSDVDKVKDFLLKVSAAMREAPKVNDNATATLLGAFINSVGEAHTDLEKSLETL